MSNPSELQEPLRKQRHRSPNYPAVSLRQAVERLRKYYSIDGKAGAPAEIAAVHIGFSTPHGQAMSVLSALKKFGLLVETNGRFVPTQRALELVNLKEPDPRRAQALKDAVLEPSIYRELIEKHAETGWPSADVLESELVTYNNFNPAVVATFVRDLFDSLEFAGLSNSPSLGYTEGEDTEEDEMEPAENIPTSQTRNAQPQPASPSVLRQWSTASSGSPTPGSSRSTIPADQISTPVGRDAEGQPVFAHVRFDGEIRKEYVASLKKYLDYLEGTLQ